MMSAAEKRKKFYRELSVINEVKNEQNVSVIVGS